MNIIDNNIKIIFPNSINENNVKSFLSTVYKIFSYKGKSIPEVQLDLTRTKTCNLLGDLMIYKIVDYSFTHHCFYDPQIKVNKDIEKEWNSSGFKRMLFKFVRNKNAYFNNLEFEKINDLFIAPIILKKESQSSRTANAISKVCEYYNYDKDILTAISSCIGEISSNFRSHAVNDTQSVLVASGNREYFEIACADTGDGIYTTLSPVISEKSKTKVLLKALDKGITSKIDSNHSGMGLWMINLLVKCQKGELHLYSQGAFVKTENGKSTSGACANWQGTIIYIKIPLKDTSGIIKFKQLRALNQKQIKLNKI